MGHEIGEHDNAVYHKVGAWHGLGLVVPDEMTPRQALEFGGLDIHVNDYPLYFRDSFGVERLVPTNRINVREIPDASPIQYGVVSSGYHIIQPVDVADFAEALADESKGSAVVESVGSIRNGARMWLLMKAGGYEIGNGDQLVSYVLLSNGHDGGTTFRVTPTDVRVVCSNTLHMVIPRFETGELGSAAISIRHTVNVMDRVAEAKYALAHYLEVQDENRIINRKLAAVDVNTETAQAFFLESYTAEFGEIPDNPKNKIEQNRRDKALSAYASFSKRFDDERPIAGATLWNALNAFTGMVQHDAKARGADDEDRIEKRVQSNLFGLNQERSQRALQRAFRMAMA